MSAKHTPGPWRIRNNDVVYAGNRLVADCERTPYAERPKAPNIEDCANAHLIAAAPDLLDALETLIAMFDANELCLTLPNVASGIGNILRARASIAMAKGE